MILGKTNKQTNNRVDSSRKETHNALFLSSKFLLFDGWWELSNDVVQGSFYCHKCPFIQEIHEE